MTQVIFDYIASTIGAIEPSIEPDIRFADADAEGRGRVPLEEMAGQTRVFEIVPAGQRQVPLSRVDPTAWDADLIVRIRYDAPGPHDRQRIIAQMHSDAAQIARALYTGGWSGVAGLSVLNAGGGLDIEAFGLAAAGADREREKLGGYLAGSPVFISYDVT